MGTVDDGLGKLHDHTSSPQAPINITSFLPLLSPQAPVNVTSLLSHLLFLAANGGLATATALADTFTTRAFLAVALAADPPPAFVADMAAQHGEPVGGPGGAAGSKCFDLFRCEADMWGAEVSSVRRDM